MTGFMFTHSSWLANIGADLNHALLWLDAATEPWLRLAGIIVCLLSAFACLCRLDLLHVKHDRPAKIACYLFTAAFAGGVLTELVAGQHVDWYIAFGMAAAALHLIATRPEGVKS